MLYGIKNLYHTDYGLGNFRKNDEMLVDVETYDEDESYYHEKRNQVYKAPEFLNNSTCDPTACGDVYAFSIILIEIATRNDPYGVSPYLLGYYISQ